MNSKDVAFKMQNPQTQMTALYQNFTLGCYFYLFYNVAESWLSLGVCKIKATEKLQTPLLETQSHENNNNIIAKGRNSFGQKLVIPEAIQKNIRSLQVKLN